MKYKNYLASFVLIVICITKTAMALDCTQRPTCEELGYTSTPDECVDGKMAKCPWDYNAVFCMEKEKNTGVGCEIGSVLYSDLNCYDPDAAPSGLTAVGVVFNPDKKLAIPLNAKGVGRWSESTSNNVPLDSCRGETITNDSCADGKNNTAVIVAYLSTEETAAGSCLGHVTGLPGISWFLPSVAQLMDIGGNLSAINKGLSLIGEDAIEMGSSGFLSSNQNSIGYAYCYDGRSQTCRKYSLRGYLCVFDY